MISCFVGNHTGLFFKIWCKSQFLDNNGIYLHSEEKTAWLFVFWTRFLVFSALERLTIWPLRPWRSGDGQTVSLENAKITKIQGQKQNMSSWFLPSVQQDTLLIFWEICFLLSLTDKLIVCQWASLENSFQALSARLF